MLKVGDRVKLRHDDPVDDTVGVLGTITDVIEKSKKYVKRTAIVNFDNGKLLHRYEEHLHKDEEKTEQLRSIVRKMKEPEVLKYQNEALKYQKHLRVIYESAMFTDFTIICKTDEEEYKFPCHKAVIATGSASGYFARMFGSGMTESSSGEVEVQGYGNEEVEHFIKFLYVLKMEEEVLEKHSVKFLKMADQYDVPMLKADVTNFLLSRLTKETVLSMTIAAHSYNALELKSAAIDFILKNKLEENSLPEWKLALMGHEDLLFDIFSVVFKKSI